MGEYADMAIDDGIAEMFYTLDHPEEFEDDPGAYSNAIDAFADFSGLIGARGSFTELTAPTDEDVQTANLSLDAAMKRSDARGRISSAYRAIRRGRRSTE